MYPNYTAITLSVIAQQIEKNHPYDYRTLRQITGFGPNTLIRTVNQLIEAGRIERDTESRSNKFTILQPPTFEEELATTLHIKQYQARKNGK